MMDTAVAVSTWRLRLVGCVLLAASVWYTAWMLLEINRAALWLATLFVFANALGMASSLLSLVNNWRRSVPTEHLAAAGTEPGVLVIIPTCGEPTWMVERTAESVLEQDWPPAQLYLVVSDDGHRPANAAMVNALASRHSEAHICYHEPPLRGDPARRGDAKAGNLNSAYATAMEKYGPLPFVETRDADDLVDDRRFIRRCVGQLLADERQAFVQTVKKARVSPGDPFNNNELMFYRGLMLGRNASNAVFPCGSGVLWRRLALDDIGGFPSWNLVEDLQSGVEALKRGWRGTYLPIIGALAQYAPEDIPNVYKQRGTWAIDTMRLILFGRLRGLSLRQQLQFIHLGFFYVSSLSPMLLMVTLIVSVACRIPVVTSSGFSYAIHSWPYFIASLLFFRALAPEQGWTQVWRWFQMFVGLGPVFLKAIVIALVNGPNRKPVYRVTRKETLVRWYWRETLVQIAVTIGVLIAVGVGAGHVRRLSAADAISLTWVVVYGVLMLGFVAKGWYGVHLFRPGLFRRGAGAGDFQGSGTGTREVIPVPAPIPIDGGQPGRAIGRT